jgi:hypothetical protein
MKTSPIRVAKKWGQKYAAGVNLRNISAPNLFANWLGEIVATRPSQRAEKRREETKRAGLAGGSAVGG